MFDNFWTQGSASHSFRYDVTKESYVMSKQITDHVSYRT